MSMSRKSPHLAGSILAAAGLCLGLVAGEASAATPLCNISAQPSLHDIGLAITNNNQFISDYNKLSEAAWCTFIALSWPAQGTSPTMTGDPNMKIGQGAGVTPTVWETWLDSTQVFCANGNAPGQCGGPTAFQEVQNGRPLHRVKAANPNTAHFALDRIEGMLKTGHKVSPRLRKLAATADSANDLSENVQATGFMLPDKNNTQANQSIILYEVRENPATVDFLTQNALYNLNGQTTFYNAQGGKPVPPAATNPVQASGSAFEVKPSWYVTNADEAKMLGFFTTQGQCAPNTNCGNSGNTFPIGLTGFHVLWKVFQGSSWFWATFEYDNTTSQPPHDNSYITPILNSGVTFYPPGVTYCPEGTAQGPNGTPPCKTTSYPPAAASPDPVVQGAAYANGIYPAMLQGTPFANYRLAGVQVAFMLNGVPTLVANNHIETDFGANQPSTGNPSSSCITCHYYASIGPLNTSPCTQTPAKSANVRRLGIFATATSGYTGAGQPSLYTNSKGTFASSDFLWSVQLAQWNLAQGNGCPPSAKATSLKRSSTAKKKPAAVKPATGATKR
jgi:hypothetical protein